MAKMYLYAENEIPICGGSKDIAQTRQTQLKLLPIRIRGW